MDIWSPGKRDEKLSYMHNNPVKRGLVKPACSAGPAVRPCGSSSGAGSCRAANRTIRFRLGPAPNTVSENIHAAPSKPRRGGKAARLESEPCATFPFGRAVETPPAIKIGGLNSEPCATIHPMSRLRRLLISGKIFFVTWNLLRTRLPFVDPDFACLAVAIRGVRTRSG